MYISHVKNMAISRFKEGFVRIIKKATKASDAANLSKSSDEFAVGSIRRIKTVESPWSQAGKLALLADGEEMQHIS